MVREKLDLDDFDLKNLCPQSQHLLIRSLAVMGLVQNLELNLTGVNDVEIFFVPWPVAKGI